MTTSIRDILDVKPNNISYVDVGGRDPTSELKAFARDFQLEDWNVRSNLEGDILNQFEGETDEDAHRLDRKIGWPPLRRKEVASEEEAAAHFMQDMMGPVLEAFHRAPWLRDRYQSGPPGPTNTRVTIDIAPMVLMIGMPHAQCVAIGECKKPGIIKANDWNRTNHPTQNTTKNLAKELRGFVESVLLSISD